jgi:hypothetical protein
MGDAGSNPAPVSNFKIINMIYKTEIDDHSFIEAEACNIDKYVQLHIVQGFKSHEGNLIESIINLELDDKMCRDLITSLRYGLDDLHS